MLAKVGAGFSIPSKFWISLALGLGLVVGLLLLLVSLPQRSIGMVTSEIGAILLWADGSRRNKLVQWYFGLALTVLTTEMNVALLLLRGRAPSHALGILILTLGLVLTVGVCSIVWRAEARKLPPEPEPTERSG